MRADQITEPIAYHGEGPVWSPTWGGLRWVDMLSGDILSLDDEKIERTHVGEIAAAVRPRLAGGAIIAVERGFVLEHSDGTYENLPELWSRTDVRMNEGGCDPQGRFWCGSMAYDATPHAAALYSYSPNGATHTVLEGVTISNGIEWSPGGDLVYYNDTATHQVAVFDYSPNGELSNRRVLADLDDGLPDGLTVDAEGAVWVAVANGGQVRRYLPDGRLDGIVRVPAQKTTACTFGGDDLSQLFITTSQEDIDIEQDPLAGSLFRADVGVKGLPVRAFTG